MTVTGHTCTLDGQMNTSDGTIQAVGMSDWRQVAAKRRDEIYSKIPVAYIVPPTLLGSTNVHNLAQKSGILSSRELSIVSYTATDLLKYIHNRTFTAVEVTTAFCKSAAIAHQAVGSFLNSPRGRFVVGIAPLHIYTASLRQGLSLSVLFSIISCCLGD